MDYNPLKIESKHQRNWEKLGLSKAKDLLSRAKSRDDKGKMYILVEFPYPSGDGLHVGHVRSYTALDAISRKKRMEGFNVLYPIGYDAFGLPTENYAIKTGIHPIEVTKKNTDIFRRQLKNLGLSFDWSREINTTDPEYYKWTQWIFLQFFKKGLAYRAEIPINWCPSCKIGLANEEVIGGKCERCGAETEKKEKKQWLLKITAYADRLIDDLNEVDFPEKIKTLQRNWIGRSEGTVVKFSIFPALPAGRNFQFSIEVFTTRIDTVFGATALVLAPEHEIISKIKNQILNIEEVEQYVKSAKKKSELERLDFEKEKTGIELKGVFAISPLNNGKIPVWIGDYVIAAYGGGAVMVVPAHDKRDYEFAKKYEIEIREVVSARPAGNGGQGGNTLKDAFVDYGYLINSGEFNGLKSEEAIKQITAWLERKELGSKKVNYHLRDWVFSRQHYWGEPIPIIHCEKCGAVSVSEKDLPVKLPYVKNYKPTDTGESPLSAIKEWVNVKCPKCRGLAQRETDTMPNWAGSNWYYLAYIMKGDSKFKIQNSKLYKYWMPVDLYNGGMEHTTLHLLYSRFVYKFLYDIGVVPHKEPYKKRRSHGMVLAQDGKKMSKSLGNVINPDEIVKKYGADTIRLYEMFMGPYEEAISWSTESLEGCFRFLKRAWSLFRNKEKIGKETSKKLIQKINYTIKKVGEDLENMKFNTAVSTMMELINAWQAENNILSQKDAENFLKILAPFCPHISEELWLRLGHKTSIFKEKWPKYDEKLVKKETIEMVVQINGKLRAKIEVNAEISKEEAEKLALGSEKIKTRLKDQEPKVIIFVKGKLINIVI